MPFKNREEKLAYQRKWYAEHAERVKAKVKKYKQERLRGVCLNCGGPTQGTKLTDIPEWCSKPGCVSAQRKANRELYAAYGRKGSGQRGKTDSVPLATVVEEAEFRRTARRKRKG